MVPTGSHCHEPHPCPFQPRCFAQLPDHHVSTLHRGGRRVAELLSEGIERIEDIDVPLQGIRERQRKAVQSGQLVVEGDLASALARFVSPIAFLDFETVNPAIPCWPGCAPYDAVPVQFSVHVERGGDDYAHHEWIAEGADDPRRPLAIALIDACAGASTIVAYNASFERTKIKGLAVACPDLAANLDGIAARLVDLAPVVRDHVYHPDFDGSFGLKAVSPALTGQGYDDLTIAGGQDASVGLARILFDEVPQPERDNIRRDLLAYCKRDTWAMVELLRRLREFAKLPA